MAETIMARNVGFVFRDRRAQSDDTWITYHGAPIEMAELGLHLQPELPDGREGGGNPNEKLSELRIPLEVEITTARGTFTNVPGEECVLQLAEVTRRGRGQNRYVFPPTATVGSSKLEGRQVLLIDPGEKIRIRLKRNVRKGHYRAPLGIRALIFAEREF